MVLFSLERVQKAHTGHGFSAEGPLPGIMIQLLAGMMDLDRNLMRKCSFTLCDWLGYPFQKSGRGKELKEVLNNGQTACADSSFFFWGGGGGEGMGVECMHHFCVIREPTKKLAV